LDTARRSELFMELNTVEGMPVMREPSITSDDWLLIWWNDRRVEALYR